MTRRRRGALDEIMHEIAVQAEPRAADVFCVPCQYGECHDCAGFISGCACDHGGNL